MDWIEFFPQCCDALEYLDQGMACVAGKYYNNLRPIGASLWFSIPYRLSLPPESLILAHLLLLLVSVILSTLVFSKIITQNGNSFSKSNTRVVQIVIFLTSVLFHSFFFYPILFYPLADAPAGFFVLFGIWFILLYSLRHSNWMLAVAGISLGLAAWVRTYYLYPVLFLLAIYLILWVVRRERRAAELLFFIALAPILVQYVWTYRNFGYVSYLHDEKAGWWTEVHLSSNAMGKDSRLPGIENRWPSGCAIERGFLGILEHKDIPGMGCLFSKRLQFYYGSYSPVTYLENESQRIWSLGFLFFNILGLLGAILFYSKQRKQLGVQGILIIFLLAFILGEGMIIMPEQRFMISISVVVWLTFVAGLFTLSQKSQSGTKTTL